MGSVNDNNPHLPVHTASHRGQIPGTTSPQCGRRLASEEPLVQDTVFNKKRKSEQTQT